MNTLQQPKLIQDLGMQYPTEKSKHKARYGLYKCMCGSYFKALISDVKLFNTNSCGCFKHKKLKELKTTHGLSKHRIFSIWNSMMQRCNNKNNSNFIKYGNRGIKVCERWIDVRNFIEDMYPSYKEGLTIDRIDNDGNYEPSNCRWTTIDIQNANTRVLRSSNTSGYRGVSFDKSRNKWYSEIMINKKKYYIGRFSTSKHAALAYDTFIIVYGLEHTRNFL